MCSWGSPDATSISSRHVSSGEARVCGSVLLQRDVDGILSVAGDRSGSGRRRRVRGDV